MIAVIGILVGLLLPAIQQAREAARRLSCKNNLRQLGLGLQNFESTYKYFPSSLRPTQVDSATGNFDGWSTLAQILPYLEQGSAFNNINFDVGYSAAASFSAEDQSVYLPFGVSGQAESTMPTATLFITRRTMPSIKEHGWYSTRWRRKAATAPFAISRRYGPP